MNNPHVQNIIAKTPRLEAGLVRALASESLRDALIRAAQCDDGVLAENLATDLAEAFPELEGGVPRTVEDLEARETMKKDPAFTNRTVEEMWATKLEQRTGGASDYLAQRMMAVLSLLDFGENISHFPKLEASLRREADRIATLLVAFQRADRIREDALAQAAAK